MRGRERLLALRRRVPPKSRHLRSIHFFQCMCTGACLIEALSRLDELSPAFDEVSAFDPKLTLESTPLWQPVNGHPCISLRFALSGSSSVHLR
jgi:hypothetical protein